MSLLDRVEIMTQVGEALRYAHANGIMHRGLKPSHIHVQPDGAVKVRSFSIDLLARSDAIHGARAGRGTRSGRALQYLYLRSHS